jgi:hypothetical protein
MPASHFDANSMTSRPKFIVRHSTLLKNHLFSSYFIYVFHTVILFLRGAEGLFRFKTINYIICSINKKNVLI